MYCHDDFMFLVLQSDSIMEQQEWKTTRSSAAKQTIEETPLRSSARKRARLYSSSENGTHATVCIQYACPVALCVYTFVDAGRQGLYLCTTV